MPESSESVDSLQGSLHSEKLSLKVLPLFDALKSEESSWLQQVRASHSLFRSCFCQCRSMLFRTVRVRALQRVIHHWWIRLPMQPALSTQLVKTGFVRMRRILFSGKVWNPKNTFAKTTLKTAFVKNQSSGSICHWFSDGQRLIAKQVVWNNWMSKYLGEINKTNKYLVNTRYYRDTPRGRSISKKISLADISGSLVAIQEVPNLLMGNKQAVVSVHR